MDAGSSATFGGRTTALSQTISRPIQAAGGWFTPWLNLSHTVQQLDDYTISNPYLSDTTYEGHSVSETFATLGLSAASAPISLGGQSRLTLDGRVSYSQSLALDDYRVSIREKALGYAEEQVIERGDEGIFALRLGADLALDPQLSLSAGYEVSKQSDAEAEQNVSVRMNYRF